MSPDVILLIFLAVPILILMLLRVNASLVFLSACLGAVLFRYIGDDAASFADAFMPALSGNNLKVILVLLPVVLTTIFMIKTVRGLRLAFNLLPAVGTALLLALMIVPLLPSSQAHQAQTSDVWAQMQQLQSLIVGLSALACLFFLWTQRPKSSDHKKHH